MRNASPEAAARCLGPHVEHPDRELGLAVRSALAAAGAETAPLAADIEPALRADAEHAARCLAALAAVTPAPLLERALRDELELLRERVLALLAMLHGAETSASVALGLASATESRRSLAIEMLEVTLGRHEAALASPVVRTDLSDGARLQQLAGLARVPGDRAATLADLVEDPAGQWRSPWVKRARSTRPARRAGSFAAARQSADRCSRDARVGRGPNGSHLIPRVSRRSQIRARR